MERGDGAERLRKGMYLNPDLPDVLPLEYPFIL